MSWSEGIRPLPSLTDPLPSWLSSTVISRESIVIDGHLKHLRLCLFASPHNARFCHREYLGIELLILSLTTEMSVVKLFMPSSESSMLWWRWRPPQPSRRKGLLSLSQTVSWWQIWQILGPDRGAVSCSSSFPRPQPTVLSYVTHLVCYAPMDRTLSCARNWDSEALAISR